MLKINKTIHLWEQDVVSCSEYLPMQTGSVEEAFSSRTSRTEMLLVYFPVL